MKLLEYIMMTTYNTALQSVQSYFNFILFDTCHCMYM